MLQPDEEGTTLEIGDPHSSFPTKLERKYGFGSPVSPRFKLFCTLFWTFRLRASLTACLYYTMLFDVARLPA